MRQKPTRRVFKTAKFTKQATKARIGDFELCGALRQVIAGHADDLGGGAFEKRLNDNMPRSIVLVKGSRIWVYQYLFAKTDRDNIEDDELAAFRMLAKGYAGLTDLQVSAPVSGKHFVETCHDDDEA